MSRERDYAFEAFVEVTGADITALLADERGRINAALKQVRELNPGAESYALADEIHAKAKAWREVYPDTPLTPQALTGQWSSIMDKAREKRRSERVVAPPVPLSNEPFLVCATCEGAKMVLVETRPSKNSVSPFEEYAPCPDCNSGAVADFWRADGSRFRCMDPATTRTRMVQP
jgi:hypothetical protein